MAGILITKVTKEHHELAIKPGADLTPGQQIDDLLTSKLAEGSFVRDITVEFSDDEWGLMLKSYHDAWDSARPITKKGR